MPPAGIPRGEGVEVEGVVLLEEVREGGDVAPQVVWPVGVALVRPVHDAPLGATGEKPGPPLPLPPLPGHLGELPGRRQLVPAPRCGADLSA